VAGVILEKRKENKREKTKEGTRNELQINNIGILFYLTTVASCCLSPPHPPYTIKL